MATALNPNGTPVRIGNVTLRTPGLAGVAQSLPPTAPATRAAEQSTRSSSRRSPTPTSWSRRRSRSPPPARSARRPGRRALDQLRRAGPGGHRSRRRRELGQFLIATDESGVSTWHFPVDEANRLDVTRGTATRTYVIRRYAAPTEGAPATRGLFGAIGKKILKVLAYRLLDPIGGAVGEFFAHRWEERQRPYRLRSFLPESYGNPAPPPLAAEDWARLSAAAPCS